MQFQNLEGFSNDITIIRGMSYTQNIQNAV